MVANYFLDEIIHQDAYHEPLLINRPVKFLE